MASATQYPVILISERVEDERFAYAVAARLGSSFLPFKNYLRGVQAIHEHARKKALIFVDASAESQLAQFTRALAGEGSDPSANIEENRLHFFGDRPLSEAVYLARSPIFGTYF
ncbi:MAG: hypothetical protein EOP11_10030, partial [Proteobacteria bacterium]